VSYSIQAKQNLSSPVIIENTAHIYFDFNTGIKTNTAVNELVESGVSIYLEPKLISIFHAYPNPTSDVLFVEAMSQHGGPIHFILVDMNGSILKSGTISPGESKQISLADLPEGIYMVKATYGLTNQAIMIAKS
jgi:hypothetical protein